ncbi:MAG TPA: enoyl-CoA hydratase/isomerase family protein, partial [Dehalococcoidia bacterium]|nr:enoyl-CoA hydratase/isomerase family protein [Dehalococcoidia bacterium]
MDYEHLLLERRGAIAILTINRPERLNAMSWDGWLELGRAAIEVSRDEECRVLLLTGAGRGFCAGADLIAPQKTPPPERFP